MHIYRVNVKGFLAKGVLCRRAPQKIKENWRPRCPLTIRNLWKQSGGTGRVQQVVDPSIEQNSEFKGNIGVLVHHATLTQCFVRCSRCWSSSPVAFRGCAPGRVRGAERATHVGSGAACATCSSWIGRSECRPRERRHLFGVSQSAHSVDEAARTRWAAQKFIRRPVKFLTVPSF